MKILFFAPGIMGSILRKNEQVWPPTIPEIIGGYNRIEKLLDPDLAAVGLIRKMGPIGVYQTLLNDFSNCGYSATGSQKRLIEFPYDWRRPNKDTAEQLALRLDEAFEEVREADPEIFFIGHSMGGLIMRYVLESGDFSERAWFGKIRWLLTLGTPHTGAPVALHRLAGKEGTLGLRPADVQRLANDPLYPSLYELIPPATTALTSTPVGPHSIPSRCNPFNSALTASLGMQSSNIDSAEEFWQSLDPSKRPDEIDYFSVVSASHKTMVRNELAGQTSLLAIERDDAGDGTVPIASAIDDLIPHEYSGKKHGTIFLDRRIRRMLYKLLEAPVGVLPQSANDAPVGEERDAVGFSFHKESYAPGEPIHLAVSYSSPQENPSISLTLTKIDLETEEPSEGAEPRSINARFRGVNLTDFRMVFENDFEPGIYLLESSAQVVDDAEPTYLTVTSVENA